MNDWTAVVYRDGVPVTGQVPCTDWEVASMVAPVFAGWSGGPVSVAKAVVRAQLLEQVPGQLDVFEVLTPTTAGAIS